MILQQYYEQKKAQIDSIVNADRPRRDQIQIGLYNDRVFRDDDDERNPIIMFKYNNVIWNTSSEKEYKADVDFCIYVILNNRFRDDYIESFEIAKRIDEAILLHPDRSEIIQNNEDIQNGVTELELITNSALKVKEGQYTVEEDHWDKNDFYIWEISYKTTLIEKEYKKRYTMISNNAFRKRQLDGAEKEALVRKNLLALGYDLDDYKEVEYNGKKLLVFKKVKEELSINNTKEVVFNDPK